MAEAEARIWSRLSYACHIGPRTFSPRAAPTPPYLICLYVNIYIYIHIYKYTHIFYYIHIYIYIYIYIYPSIYIDIYLSSYVCIYKHINI